MLSIGGCGITKDLLCRKVWWRLWLGSYQEYLEELELPQAADLGCVAGCTKQSLLLQSPISSLTPSALPVLAEERGLLLQVSEGPDGMLHPAVQFQSFMLLSFLTHPHPAVLTRDNHSCGFEHHTWRRCLPLNISGLATITQHLKVGFSNWVTHPWKPCMSSVGLFTSIHYLKGLDKFCLWEHVFRMKVWGEYHHFHLQLKLWSWMDIFSPTSLLRVNSALMLFHLNMVIFLFFFF